MSTDTVTLSYKLFTVYANRISHNTHQLLPEMCGHMNLIAIVRPSLVVQFMWETV